ncbi:hypothetical protein BDF22DRAFT_662725 [Syncephalis plumigaleata]|nr:hypothetical protein BDF22DRAFT_662702 [Syncephalis plumigaleata]KAI8057888.1 hypothetical protein BDF22DRAFT_662725 [Syncephalis plumigaleata]
MFSSQYQLAFILLLLLLQQWMVAEARLAIIGNNGTELVYNSTDIPFHPEQPYNYRGIALNNTFTMDNFCKPPPANASDPDLQSVVKKALEYPDFALFASINNARLCNKRRVNNAMNNWIHQWHTLGLPRIKLIVLDFHTPPYNPNPLGSYVKFPADSPFMQYILSTPITMAGIERNMYESKPIYIGKYEIYNFTATHDSNPWNDFIFTTKRLAYKWTLFALILVALLYTSARTIALIVMRKFNFNLLSASFIVSYAYCITLLVYFAYSTNPIIMNRTSYVYNFLGKISFDMIIWHWSSIGRNLFSRKSIVFLRTLMIIDVIGNIIRTAYTIVTDRIYADNNVTDSVYLIISGLAIPIMNGIIFGGFSIWFGVNAYRLRRHPEGFSKFIQLVYFSLIGFFACLIPLMLQPILKTTTKNYINVEEVILNILHLVCVYVLLSTMGIRWPRNDDRDERKAPLGGMTTVGWNTTAHEATTYNKQ